jgi:hypothetical protein
MILRNFENAKRYLDYQSKGEFESNDSIKICGWYKLIEGRFYSLRVKDGLLYFACDWTDFLVTENTHIKLTQANEHVMKVTFIENSKEIITFDWPNENMLEVVSPFEYLDSEDFIWVEFLMKIINDKVRRLHFIAINSLSC